MTMRSSAASENRSANAPLSRSIVSARICTSYILRPSPLRCDSPSCFAPDRAGRYSNRKISGKTGLLDLLIRSEKELAAVAALLRKADTSI